MLKKLREQIFHVGLFACLPAVGEEDIFHAVDALVLGGVRGIILSWNKKLFSTVEKLHVRYPQLLIGVQGPYEKACQLFAGGASFVVDTGGVPAKIQVPFLLRQNNNLGPMFQQTGFCRRYEATKMGRNYRPCATSFAENARF